jgi:hypothetical protein
VCPGDETVGAYVAGGLADATRSDFEQHLDTCSTCQELVASLARANAPTADASGEAPAGEPGARKTLGRYVIETVLGAGGMGVVYRAHDPELGRPIALKVVRPLHGQAQTHARARLVREARAMAKIAHPNVIVVHDAGAVGDEVYIAMELVDGENLADWQRAKPRSWRDVVEVYLQAGRGLAAAHRAGLVHRDFKPHNTLVATEGRVRVLDFGLARSVDDDGAPHRPSGMSAPLTSSTEATLTRTGTVMGSPQFMSPEQHGGLRADARSDQFSYCVALYHALYGAYPYTGATYEALALAVTEGEATPAPRTTKVPSAIGKILARGMRRAPDERYASMDDVVIALTSAVRGRRPFWVAGLALAAIGGLAVALAVVAARSKTTASSPIAMGFAKHQQAITATGAYVGMPDLSPDGRHLAYATATGFALRDLTTGETHEVPGFDNIAGIRWSHAGDRLVISTPPGPVVVAPDGTAPHLFPLFTTTCTAAWSADDTEIMWGCDGKAGFTLLTLATGATRPVKIPLPASESVSDFDWSASGIAIATHTDGDLDSNTLWLASADGTKLSKLVNEPETNGSLRWNARGDRIYYTRVANPGFEIVYRDARDATHAPVTVLVQPLSEFWTRGSFALARDERSIIYPQRHTYLDVMLHGPGTTAPRELTADRIPKQALSVSPDSKSIVYAAGSLEQMSLYRQRFDGSAPQKLAAPERFYIQSAVSPDGANVVATSLIDNVAHTSIVPVGPGTARDVEHPPTNLVWPIEWTPQNQIFLLAASRSNFVVIDPATDKPHLLWPSDGEEPLFTTAIAPDGQHIAANIPMQPAGSGLVVISIADRSVRVISPVSAAMPIGWSADGKWIYVNEDHSEDPKRRVVAVSAAGDGTSRLIAVTGRGGEPAVLPDESGVVQVAKNTLTDLWLASIVAVPQVPPGPPAVPAPPASPPAFHPAPVNLALAGAPGAQLDGWVVAGSPHAPAITTTCGRPGTCVELDGASAGSISQYIDATRYRGRRIRIELDARVEKTTLFVGANSGVFTRTELPAGRIGVTEGAWARHAVDADIAPDAVFVKIKAMLPEAGGRAWIANLTITP